MSYLKLIVPYLKAFTHNHQFLWSHWKWYHISVVLTSVFLWSVGIRTVTVIESRQKTGGIRWKLQLTTYEGREQNTFRQDKQDNPVNLVKYWTIRQKSLRPQRSRWWELWVKRPKISAIQW